MTSPGSVRLAMPAEATHIARLQRESWLRVPGGDQLVAQVTEADATAAWQHAITRPPLATMRVLVALDPFPVGYVVTGPSDDPDARPNEGQIAEMAIDDPASDNAARLLNAAVDTLKADGFTVATWWLRSDDDATRALLTETGWAPDGAHREIATDDSETAVRWKMLRLRTRIADED